MTVLGIILGIMLAISITLFVIKKRRDDALRAIEEQKEQKRQAQLIEAKICDTVESLKPCYKQYIDHFYNVLLHSEHYFTASEKDKFINETKDHLTKLEFLHNNNALERLENADRLLDAIQGIDTIRKEHNEKFVNKEMLQQSEFFDNILDYPLDNQQRESIVKLEDNCLVISSAGSGKTSTMIGKLLYLVRQRKVDPSRILTITYTHKASDELTTRLKGTGLSCMTFHKLAMTIIAHIEGKKPSIAGNDLFIKVFYDQLSNSIFRNAILNYLTDYKSLVKEEHSYLNSVDYYRDRKKYGVIALYPDKDGKTIFTKSEEEKRYAVTSPNLASHLSMKSRMNMRFTPKNTDNIAPISRYTIPTNRALSANFILSTMPSTHWAMCQNGLATVVPMVGLKPTNATKRV